MRRLIYVFVLMFFVSCATLYDFEDKERIPASWSAYRIDTVANDPALKRLYPDAEHSECGLADDDFIKYARDRIDYRREFQFMVFISGKPLVGGKCYKRALMYYLK